MIGLGWVFELIYNVKRKKKVLVRTFAEKADGMLWLSLGISMTLLGFVGVGSGAINIEFLSAVLSIVIAAGYFVTGVLYDVKWVRNLAFGWWGGALIMFLIPGHVSLLLMALMMFLLQIIPGYIIYKKWSTG